MHLISKSWLQKTDYLPRRVQKIQRRWQKMSLVHSEIENKWIFPLSNEVEMIQSTRLWVRMLLMDLYSILYKASELSIERFSRDSWKHPGMSSRKKSLLGWGPYLGCVSEERIKSLLLIMRESRIPQWFGVTPSTRAAIFDKSGQGHPSFLYLRMEGSKMAINLLKCVRKRARLGQPDGALLPRRTKTHKDGENYAESNWRIPYLWEHRMGTQRQSWFRRIEHAGDHCLVVQSPPLFGSFGFRCWFW